MSKQKVRDFGGVAVSGTAQADFSVSGNIVGFGVATRWFTVWWINSHPVLDLCTTDVPRELGIVFGPRVSSVEFPRGIGF